MKKMKMKIGSFLFGLMIVVAACTPESPVQEVDLNEFGINTTENRQAALNLMQDEDLVKKIHQETLNDVLQLQGDEITSQSNSELEDQIDLNELLAQYEECGACHSEAKELLIPLMESIISSRNDEVLDVLNGFEKDVLQANFTDEVKSDLLFLSYVFKESTEVALEQGEELGSGFWDCFGSSVGRGIGEGIAVGFMGGCIKGGWAGATAGTFTVPGLGTAAGGLAGCALGGAVGAVGGAIGGALLSAAKCIFNE